VLFVGCFHRFRRSISLPFKTAQEKHPVYEDSIIVFLFWKKNGFWTFGLFIIDFISFCFRFQYHSSIVFTVNQNLVVTRYFNSLKGFSFCLLPRKILCQYIIVLYFFFHLLLHVCTWVLSIIWASTRPRKLVLHSLKYYFVNGVPSDR